MAIVFAHVNIWESGGTPRTTEASYWEPPSFSSVSFFVSSNLYLFATKPKSEQGHDTRWLSGQSLASPTAVQSPEATLRWKPERTVPESAV